MCSFIFQELFCKDFSKDLIDDSIFFRKNLIKICFKRIGFKEFDDYLSYIDENKNKKDEQIFEKTKQNLFDQAVADMKLSTRRYAKTQVKWVKNRFIKSNFC